MNNLPRFFAYMGVVLLVVIVGSYAVKAVDYVHPPKIEETSEPVTEEISQPSTHRELVDDWPYRVWIILDSEGNKTYSGYYIDKTRIYVIGDRSGCWMPGVMKTEGESSKFYLRGSEYISTLRLVDGDKFAMEVDGESNPVAPYDINTEVQGRLARLNQCPGT